MPIDWTMCTIPYSCWVWQRALCTFSILSIVVPTYANLYNSHILHTCVISCVLIFCPFQFMPCNLIYQSLFFCPTPWPLKCLNCLCANMHHRYWYVCINFLVAFVAFILGVVPARTVLMLDSEYQYRTIIPIIFYIVLSGWLECFICIVLMFLQQPHNLSSIISGLQWSLHRLA